MAGLRLNNVMKRYDNGFVAVSNFNLDIEDKEFIIFVGPSGCGKSTTLRMIAGLEEITEGELYIDNKLINNIPPKDRDIAMVFQSYALYPHMTVYDNMAFGLKLRKTPKKEIEKRVKEAAKVLSIDKLLERKPKALSGGERQRVAMGRAIVREPQVFLMDEPLSNLDAQLRVQMRSEITKLHQRLQTTFIYVTHDQTEALTLGTRIVVMKDGIIQQVDAPAKLYNEPNNMFVASFIGSPQMNMLEALVIKRGDDIMLGINKYEIMLHRAKAKAIEKAGYVDKSVVLGIRPEDLHYDEAAVSTAEPSAIVEAEVELRELLGAEVLLHLKLAGQQMTACVSPRSSAKSGDRIKIAFDLNNIHVFDMDSEKIISREM